MSSRAWMGEAYMWTEKRVSLGGLEDLMGCCVAGIIFTWYRLGLFQVEVFCVAELLFGVMLMLGLGLC